MRGTRIVAAVALTLSLFALTAISGVASRSANEQLAGIETGIPQPSSQCPSGANVELSPFAGSASGSIQGSWSAGACHGPIPSTIGQSVPLLPGGSFSVNGLSTNFRYVSLYGAFGPADGSITLVQTTGSLSGFNTQVFAITGPLTGGNIRGGTMSVTLTHYRFGTQTLEATVTGSASIAY